MKAGPENNCGLWCGSQDIRDIEAWVPMVMSREMPLP